MVWSFRGRSVAERSASAGLSSPAIMGPPTPFAQATFPRNVRTGVRVGAGSHLQGNAATHQADYR